MIDNLSLAITHGLLMLAAVILLRRRDLDDESAEASRGFRRREKKPGA